MTAYRAAFLGFFLMLTAMSLALTGDHFFGSGQGIPSLAVVYGLNVIVLLCWLGFFGSKP